MLARAAGTSRIRENIFEDRLEWLTGLRAFGADVEILDARTARITGPTRFAPGEAEIPDLRAGATLVLAALAQEIQLDAGRRAGALHLFSLRLCRADGDRNLFPRAELGFLLVASAVAGTLTPTGSQMANLRLQIGIQAER